MDFSRLPVIHKQELFEALESGGLLLTVNNRLSRRFTNDYNQWQLQQKNSLWDSPKILPLAAWLQQQFDRIGDKGLHKHQMLTSSQEKQLWIEIIKADAFDLYMMQPSAISKQVMQAWQLMQQWNIPAETLLTFDSPETKALLKWSSAFTRRCQRHRWLSQTLIIAKIAEAIATQQCPLPETIMLAGFEDPNKLHQQLIESFVLQNCKVYRYQHQSINVSATLKACIDFNSEIVSAANWAKQILLHSEGQTEKKQICIVVPSLNDNREFVYNCFKNVLHPERQSAPPYAHESLFNLSLGLPLSEYPLVFDALSGFALLQPFFSQSDLSRVLNSQYLLNQETVYVRSQVDCLLRDTGRQQWTLKAFLQFLHSTSSNTNTANISHWIKSIEDIQIFKKDMPSRLTPENWSKNFLSFWKIMGWPGNRTLDSHEYQQSERLLKLLSEFRQIHPLKPLLDLPEAISLLKQMANEVIFQVQSDDAPVQVCGILEAADQQFDHLWFSGLEDQSFPAKTAPNPFIPLSIQKQFNLPHSSAEREQAYATKILQQFKQNAGELIISYPQREQDSDLRPSPLLATLQLADNKHEISDQADKHDAELNDQIATQLEAYSDITLVALPENMPVKGGTAVLTQQAQCPFKASASFRLKAIEPAAVTDGASPLDQGNQLHSIMEKLWAEIRNRKQLFALSEQQLNALLERIINDVLAVYRFKRPDLYLESFYALEKKRLQKLIHNWLVIEKQREMDFSVIEMEQDKTISTGGLVFKTKADRVDRLASGEHIILDYKTGQSASSASWQEENITEPQLPLYSLNESEQLSAIALAKVNEKRCQFNGVAKDNAILPGIKAFQANDSLLEKDQENADEADHWALLLGHWKIQLDKIATSFRQGQAEINPSDCRFCGYAVLCRKHEIEPVGDDRS